MEKPENKSEDTVSPEEAPIQEEKAPAINDENSNNVTPKKRSFKVIEIKPDNKQEEKAPKTRIRAPRKTKEEAVAQ